MRSIQTKKTNSEGTGASAGSFFSGVALLSLSTVIVKIIGLAYKIPMIAYLGAEGMGYFNSAYEIYAMLCVISTAGLPVALSILISSNREARDTGAVRGIWRSALTVFCVLGLVGSGLLLLFAKPLAVAIGNEGAYASILGIAPALLFVCLSSAVRGYFQGYSRMAPTAISQLIEAVGKLVFGVLFAAVALRQGADIPSVAAYAILGLTLGTLLSAVYLLILKAMGKGVPSVRDEPVGKGYGKALLKIALPITVSSAVLSVTRLTDMALILRRLQDIGVSVSEANRIYGSYTTLALPVFGLIPALITPISLALVPELSAAVQRGDREGQSEIAERSVRLTVLLSMPASMGVALYATQILTLLFPAEPEAIAISAPLLALLGVSILLSGLITTTGAILQSYRQVGKPILSMAIGAAVKLIGAYVLIGHPSVGVAGAPISTFFCNLTVTALNLWFIHRCVPQKKGLWSVARLFVKPAAVSLGAMAASVAVYLPIRQHTDGGSIAFLAAMGSAVVTYLLIGAAARLMSAEELSMLPIGKQIVAWMRKTSQSGKQNMGNKPYSYRDTVENNRKGSKTNEGDNRGEDSVSDRKEPR